jgi:hypothetical protein
MFERQFDAGQSMFVLSWPLHSKYDIDPSTRIIRGEGYDGRAYLPLEYADLFLSFARLGAHGEPSEKSILSWVETHGLLTRGDEKQGVNQKPVSVYEFREEVRCARELAALFMDIREQNSAAIWGRFAGEGDYQAARFHDNPVDNYFATFQRDESFLRSLEPPDDPVHLQSGAAALEHILERRLIDGVTLQPLSAEFVVDDEGTLHLHSWAPHEPYRPMLSWRCPDLRSALYLQFALMVTDTKLWKRCANPNCKMPFPAKPSNRQFCKAGCRSTGRNHPH